MFEQTFKNVDDFLWKDAGCSSELDYVEQTSWVLFLKYLDDLEKDKATAAELTGKTHTNIIAPEFQWTIWAAPKLKSGKIDHNALTGDDLVDFVNGKLFPYLKNFKTDAEHADTIEYKIGEIFSELKNRIESGYSHNYSYNFWGYAGGYYGFSGPKQAVETVGKRIDQLRDQGLNTPAKIVTTWKCGRSCASHAPGSVQRWVSTVSGPYYRIAMK